MTAKLKTGCSVVVPLKVANEISKLPAATAVTYVRYLSVPDFWQTMTVSVAATTLFVTVKAAIVVEPAAETSVIAPQALLSVTPVVRLVACVTAPPAPVAHAQRPPPAASTACAGWPTATAPATARPAPR